MTWLPDSKLLRILLELKGDVAFALALTCWLALFLAENEILYLEYLPLWLRSILTIVAILSTAILAINVISSALNRYRKYQYKRDIIRYLDTLNQKEKYIFSYLLTNNISSFVASAMHCDELLLLERKGLLNTKGFVLLSESCPFIVPEFVWQQLQRRKREFDISNNDSNHPPWQHIY